MTSTFELSIKSAPVGGLTVTMMVDGKPFGENCVDLAELRKSAISSGAYSLQTCGCGVPECAGFWEPIFVVHEDKVIRWEFDENFHPKPNKNKEGSHDSTILRIEFDRLQYIQEIQGKFEWLKLQPNCDSLGPYGFDAAILNESFPDAALIQLPFPTNSTIIVGYTKTFHQPWVWIEGCPDIFPKQLLPTAAMWASFGNWSLMWDCEDFGLGQCVYRPDSLSFILKNNIAAAECNKAVEELVCSLQQHWGKVAKIIYEQIDEITRIHHPLC